MAKQPNAEMTMIAWIRTIPGVDATKVATTIPGDPSKWNATGFVTVELVGGAPSQNVKKRQPVLSISAWAVTLNSERAPWVAAHDLAETIFDAFYDPNRFPLLTSWTGYENALIHTGYPMMEPRKVPGSEAGYAQVQFDATLAWTTEPQ